MTPEKEAIKIAATKIFMQKGALSAAAYLAETLFDGITDKADAPYIGHLQRVANGVSDYFIKPIAFMHDILEDCEDWETKDLTDIGFDEFTTDGVVGVTRNGGEPYFDFIVRCAQTPQSIPVKRSDLKDNSDIFRIPSLPTETDIERLKKYHLSEHYLADINSGSNALGTPFAQWLTTKPVAMQDWDLFVKNSSEALPQNAKASSAQPKGGTYRCFDL